jgi:hypothetical protein
LNRDTDWRTATPNPDHEIGAEIALQYLNGQFQRVMEQALGSDV